MDAIDRYFRTTERAGLATRSRQMYGVDEDETSRRVATEVEVGAAERELGYPAAAKLQVVGNDSQPEMMVATNSPGISYRDQLGSRSRNRERER